MDGELSIHIILSLPFGRASRLEGYMSRVKVITMRRAAPWHIVLGNF